MAAESEEKRQRETKEGRQVKLLIQGGSGQ